MSNRIWIPGYDAPADNGHDPHKGADIEWCQKVGQCLDQHYGGYPWVVEADSRQKLVLISIPTFMPKNLKFALHMSVLATDPGLKAVMRAGGEILERWNIPRTARVAGDPSYREARSLLDGVARAAS